MSAALKIHHPKEDKPIKPFRDYHKKFLLAYHDAGEDGLTDSELMFKLNTTKGDANGRRMELVSLGYVKRTEEKRKTCNGRNAIVFKITERGYKRVPFFNER